MIRNLCSRYVVYNGIWLGLGLELFLAFLFFSTLSNSGPRLQCISISDSCLLNIYVVGDSIVCVQYCSELFSQFCIYRQASRLRYKTIRGYNCSISTCMSSEMTINRGWVEGHPTVAPFA